MSRKFLSISSFLAAISVILGAFGAHYLKTKLTVEQLQTFETAVRYQMYHSLAMLVVSVISEKTSSKYLRIALMCFLVGICFFSGSLYLLSTKNLLGIEQFSKILGPITPLGGLCFIAGWIMVFIFSIKEFHLTK